MQHQMISDRAVSSLFVATAAITTKAHIDKQNAVHLSFIDGNVWIFAPCLPVCIFLMYLVSFNEGTGFIFFVVVTAARTAKAPMDIQNAVHLSFIDGNVRIFAPCLPVYIFSKVFCFFPKKEDSCNLQIFFSADRFELLTIVKEAR